MIFVDFDHTLFAGNSTEEYLRRARPVWLINLFVLVIYAAPWRSLGSRWHRIRDYAAVVVVTAVSPWNLLRWRRGAADLFQQRINNPVDSWLRDVPTGRMVIVSFGFEMLIGPLVAGTRWAESRRVCTQILAPPSLLRSGKLDLVRNMFGQRAVETGTLITDSEDDADLLGQVLHPVVVPPAYGPFGFQEFLYHPMRYTAKAKYAARYVRNQTLFVDLPLLALATLPQQFSWTYLGALLSMFLSMAAVYEIGYFENDQVAAKREKEPRLTKSARHFAEFPFAAHAWPWAAALGAIGSYLASAHGKTALNHSWPKAFATWMLMLGLVRILFLVYNRSPANSRILVYPILQAAKVFGPLTILYGSAVGAAILLAQVMTMWINYIVYRTGGDQHQLSRDRMRLVTFVVLFSGLLTACPHDIFSDSILQICVAGIWILILAWKTEIARTISRLKTGPRQAEDWAAEPSTPKR